MQSFAHEIQSLIFPGNKITDQNKEDVEFDVKNRNSSIAFLYMKSKCANFACVLLDQ